MTYTAIIDATGTYRYSLTRKWPQANINTALFIMLNPSTADASNDDPTIRKCIGFAKRLNCNQLEVVNLFAMRSTDPKQLKTTLQNPIGPENDLHIRQAAERADTIIASWGSWQWPEVKARIRDVKNLLRGKTVYCLKKNLDGEPAHPLYLPGNSQLQEFSR